MRLVVTNEDENDVLSFFYSISLERVPSNNRTFRISNDGHQLAVAHVIGKAVIPAADRVLRKTLRASGERDTPMHTSVLDRIDASLDALEQNLFAKQLGGEKPAVGELTRKEGGIPMIAEAERCLDVF